ncbi:MAG: carbon-nitrogen hydrolase family protein [Anaerolineales bacterium]|nr:carbon-nitrogen hydrolase family protein [Anaerolineales bacterium]
MAAGAELGTFLAGSLLLREDGQVHNRLVLAQPDGHLHGYAKQHPFLWEGCYFAAGRAPLIGESELGRLGLLICWGLAHPQAWQAYASRVDALLIASAPPRFHRAVVNFPRGRRVFLAQLLPALLRQRAALDRLYSAHVGACAAAFRPRYWSWAAEAGLATLRASFYGGSALFGADG